MWIWICITACVVILLAFGLVWVVFEKKSPIILTPLSVLPPKEKPLEKYSIDNLAKRSYTPSPIIFEDPIATTSSYSVLPFYFMSDGPTSSDDAGLRGAGKKVTGLAHVPNIPLTKKLPVIVQFRGFVDPKMYTPGVGTKHSAESFASNGFVSLAPDFLGYGGSDKGSTDVFEDRFQTYTTALNLLASIPNISFIDPTKVGIWGHSNGGQIALTVLTILESRGTMYPTSLWAPVTAVFPYSILYYTDEFEDYGKALRKELARFENEYDVNQFAFYNYIDRIQAPLQLHQGTEDEAVPVKWSDAFVKRMQQQGSRVKYYTYPGNDHNFAQSWNTVMNRDLEFFRSMLR